MIHVNWRSIKIRLKDDQSSDDLGRGREREKEGEREREGGRKRVRGRGREGFPAVHDAWSTV